MKRNAVTAAVAVVLLAAAVAAGSLLRWDGEEPDADGLTARERELASRVIAFNTGNNYDSWGEMVRNVLISWAYHPSIYDMREVVTERSTQIVLAHIDSYERAEVSVASNSASLVFLYNLTVLEIYLDVSGTLSEGDEIKLYTGNGIMWGPQLAKMSGGKRIMRQHGREFIEFSENEYVISSHCGEMVLEPGYIYLLYLNEYHIPGRGWYVLSDGRYIHEYTEGVVFTHRDYRRAGITIEELRQRTIDDVAARTGRVQEVGEEQYLSEVAERWRWKNGYEW